MLEKMGEFFDNRLEGYEEHQLTCIESAQEFYPYTANCLPKEAGCKVLDLGCGTGLELTYYFRENPSASVTGIDLAPGMLGELKKKFPKQDLTLILGSYFKVPLGEELYEAAVSVESLHHFTKVEKISLYNKLYRALTPDGYFILTDYFAPSGEEEVFYRQELLRLKAEQRIDDEEFYHYDTPLTVQHEIEALREAGFSEVEVLNSWGATHTIRARRMKHIERNKCRIIKIGKEALYEFIYETFIEKQADLLGVDSLKVADTFSVDWENGSFIFCAHACEDESENFIPFPEDIDVEELLKKLPDTTGSVLVPKAYKEYSFDELRELMEKSNAK